MRSSAWALGDCVLFRNEDRIARPARGRFFPLTVPETIALLRHLRFATPQYQRRVDITFQNPDPPGRYGLCVGGFRPAAAVTVCSFPEDWDHERAKAIVEIVLREFAEIEKTVRPSVGRQKVVSFWAYIGPANRLAITRRTRRATLTKYRGGAKFSHAFKPRGVKTDERILHSRDVT